MFNAECTRNCQPASLIWGRGLQEREYTNGTSGSGRRKGEGEWGKRLGSVLAVVFAASIYSHAS